MDRRLRCRFFKPGAIPWYVISEPRPFPTMAASSLGGREVVATNSFEAGYWRGTSDFTGIGELPGGNVGSAAYDISPDGSTIVGYSSSPLGDEPVFWNEAQGLVSLNAAGGTQFVGVANGVSENGRVIVGNLDFTSGPFIWDASHGIRRLQAVLTTDYGLNLGLWQWSSLRHDDWGRTDPRLRQGRRQVRRTRNDSHHRRRNAGADSPPQDLSRRLRHLLGHAAG